MLQLRILIASLTIGYFTFRGVTAQLNVRIPLTKEFDNFATETLDNWKVPGLSTAVDRWQRSLRKGKRLRDVLKELIWVPLDMDSTLFDLQDASHAPNQLASGYYWDIKEGKYGEVPFINVTQLSGAGAIFSNVLDFAKWVKCLLHEAAPFFKEVHRDIKSSRMIEPTQLDEPSDMVTYGLGWHHSLFKGHVIYTHSGGVHIYGAQVYWLPSIRYGVVAFANTALTSNAVEEILAWNLIQDRLKIPENERSDVKSKSDTPSTVLRNVY
ncbi:hypothetical protein FOMA001_g8997 [Fusarium oxysporum f. sp. matthiolae]|nr:hypothetical protein FOMA001_g8997 [Fusarium oxysporum f. sp. matthiolae]